MPYVLNENIGLRSWQLVPWAYYVRNYPYAQKLSREECELLSKCDGVQELEKSPLLIQLEKKGFVKEAAQGESWSR